MDYELCKKLKDLGFPQEDNGNKFYCNGNLCGRDYECNENIIRIPTLSELIKECGPTKIAPNQNTKEQKPVEHFFRLGVSDGWFADYEFYESTAISNVTRLPITGWGSTSEEAVANLWLEINN